MSRFKVGSGKYCKGKKQQPHNLPMTEEECENRLLGSPHLSTLIYKKYDSSNLFLCEYMKKKINAMEKLKVHVLFEIDQLHTGGRKMEKKINDVLKIRILSLYSKLKSY